MREGKEDAVELGHFVGQGQGRGVQEPPSLNIHACVCVRACVHVRCVCVCTRGGSREEGVAATTAEDARIYVCARGVCVCVSRHRLRALAEGGRGNNRRQTRE